MTGNHSKVVTKLCKPANCSPSYNFTILSKPKTINENLNKITVNPKRSIEPLIEVNSPKLSSNTTCVLSPNVNSLTSTIRDTTHISSDDKNELILMSSLNNSPWISAELVIGDVSATTVDTSLTSVTWAMTASDQSVVDAARDWFRSSSLAERRTYSHGSITAKTIQKRRERSMNGFHPLCQTVIDNQLAHPYL